MLHNFGTTSPFLNVACNSRIGCLYTEIMFTAVSCQPEIYGICGIHLYYKLWYLALCICSIMYTKKVQMDAAPGDPYFPKTVRNGQ